MSLAAPLLAILADPSWLAMDPTAKGYHIQLLLVAAQRTPAGTLPGTETTLRRYLGMGSAKIKKVPEAKISKNLEEYLQNDTSNLAALLGAWWVAAEEAPPIEDAQHQVEAWQEHLWEHRWRPMVMEAWEIIDDNLIKQKPHLAKAKGGFYNHIAENLANITQQSTPISTVKKTGSKSKKGTHRISTGSDINAFDDPKILVMGHDLDRWHDEREVFSKWLLPLDENSKRSLWEVGVMAMAGPNSTVGDRTRAKTLLGKLVKTHGEAKVAEAIGVLSVRAVPVADAGAFLAAMLRNKEEGTPQEQKARSQRAHVAL